MRVLWSDLVAKPSREIFGLGCDRELGRVLVGGRVAPLNDDGKGVGEVVEGLPEVVSNVPDQQGQEGVGRLFEDADAADVLAGFKLAFIDDQAGVTLGPPLLGGVQRIQIFERPLQLEPVTRFRSGP